MQQRGSKDCLPVAECLASLSSSVRSLNLGPRPQSPLLYFTRRALRLGIHLESLSGSGLQVLGFSPPWYCRASRILGGPCSWHRVGLVRTPRDPGPSAHRQTVPCPGAHSQSRVFETLWEICQLTHHTLWSSPGARDRLALLGVTVRDDMVCGLGHGKSLARCLSCPAFSRKPLELDSDSWHAGKGSLPPHPTPSQVLG